MNVAYPVGTTWTKGNDSVSPEAGRIGEVVEDKHSSRFVTLKFKDIPAPVWFDMSYTQLVPASVPVEAVRVSKTKKDYLAGRLNPEPVSPEEAGSYLDWLRSVDVELVMRCHEETYPRAQELYRRATGRELQPTQVRMNAVAASWSVIYAVRHEHVPAGIAVPTFVSVSKHRAGDVVKLRTDGFDSLEGLVWLLQNGFDLGTNKGQ